MHLCPALATLSIGHYCTTPRSQEMFVVFQYSSVTHSLVKVVNQPGVGVYYGYSLEMQYLYKNPRLDHGLPLCPIKKSEIETYKLVINRFRAWDIINTTQWKTSSGTFYLATLMNY